MKSRFCLRVLLPSVAVSILAGALLGLIDVAYIKITHRTLIAAFSGTMLLLILRTLATVVVAAIVLGYIQAGVVSLAGLTRKWRADESGLRRFVNNALPVLIVVFLLAVCFSLWATMRAPETEGLRYILVLLSFFSLEGLIFSLVAALGKWTAGRNAKEKRLAPALTYATLYAAVLVIAGAALTAPVPRVAQQAIQCYSLVQRTILNGARSLVSTVRAEESLPVVPMLDLDIPRGRGVRVLVVGLDGGNWTVLNRLFERGQLPTLKNLVDTGASGILRSDQPSMSPILWTSIGTGMTREKHGVDGFYSSGMSADAPRFWDIAQHQGYGVGICGWLVTWPPPKVNGYLIPGWLAQDASTYPPELSFLNKFNKPEALCETLRPLLAEDTLRSTGKDADIGHGLRLLNHYILQSRVLTDFNVYMLKKYRPEVAAVVYYPSDHLQHLYWKYLVPESYAEVDEEDLQSYRNVIIDYYLEFDKQLGKLLQAVGEDTYVLIVSDHGAQALPESLHFHFIQASSLLRHLGLQEEFTATNLNTRVFFHPKTSATGSLQQLQSMLKELVIENTDIPLFIVKVEEDYCFAETSLEIAKIADLSDKTVRINGTSVPLTELLKPQTEKPFTGGHSLEGIIIARGPFIKKNYTVSGASIYDVTPTVCAMLDIPVSEEFDGKVLSSMFEPGFFRAHPPRTVETYEHIMPEKTTMPEQKLSEDVEKKLKGLGYLQ